MAAQTVVFCAFVILVERRAVEVIKSKLIAAIHSAPSAHAGTQDVDVDVANEADRVRKVNSYIPSRAILAPVSCFEGWSTYRFQRKYLVLILLLRVALSIFD